MREKKRLISFTHIPVITVKSGPDCGRGVRCGKDPHTVVVVTVVLSLQVSRGGDDDALGMGVHVHLGAGLGVEGTGWGGCSRGGGRGWPLVSACICIYI